MDPNVANMKNISMLCVRVMKFFPILTNVGVVLVLLVTMKSQKALILAKKLSRLVKVLDFKLQSKLFKQFELRCFALWTLSQSLLIVGSLFNVFSVIKMQLDSFIVITLLTWTSHSSSHIILICIFIMNFFATLVKKMAEDITGDKRNLMTSFNRLQCIREIIEEFRFVSNVVMSLAFTKLLVEILIYVIEIERKQLRIQNFKLLTDLFTIFQCILVFINYYNDIERIGSIRVMSNIFITFSNLILVCALVQPAMEIKKSLKEVIIHHSKSSSSNQSEILVTNLPSLAMHEQMAVFGSFSFNNEFLFLVINTCLSFLIVLLQFEIESAKVMHFNVFKMEQIVYSNITDFW